MTSRRKSPHDLQINLPMIQRQYSSAIEPSLTPITGSSTYSPVKYDRTSTSDLATPFDSHRSFELELRFSEDAEGYICTFQSPEVSPTSEYWSKGGYQPSTPDNRVSGSDSCRSTSSTISTTSVQTPSGIERNPYITSDSPTIPIRNDGHIADHPDFNPWGIAEPFGIQAGDKSQSFWAEPSLQPANLQPRRSELLSPITIVLDTIQEHCIMDEPSQLSRHPRKANPRMKSLPEIKRLPAIDLYESVYQHLSKASPAPPTSCPPKASSLTTTSLPLRPAPPPRRTTTGSQSKIQKLLGQTQLHREECLKDSFVGLPFHYQPPRMPRAQRMYDMI